MHSRRSATLLVCLTVLALSSCAGRPAGGEPVRYPTFAYADGKQGGCNDIFFHKETPDRREALLISANRKKLRLPDRGSKTFDLAAAPDGLHVTVDLWPTAPPFSAYCTDISSEVQREATWRAKKGTITITLDRPPDKDGRPPRQYKASVRLEDVVFEDDAGHQATRKKEAITEVLVGWTP
jgi:hypothetical protein